MHTFKNDFRKENPALHLLYTRTACKHLTVIDRMMQTLADFSNINMLGPLEALGNSRATLVRENAAYIRNIRGIAVPICT